MAKIMIVSSRLDGFGVRLLDIMVGKYLSRKLNIPFAFAWIDNMNILQFKQGLNNAKDVQYLNPTIESAEVIFDKDFLAKYLVDFNEFGYSWAGNIALHKVKDVEEIKKLPFDKPWGYYSAFRIPSDFIGNLTKDQAYWELKQSYKEIIFSKDFQEIKEQAKQKANSLGDFSAIHLRGGEMIYSEFRHDISFLKYRHFPYEIALEIGKEEIKAGRNIVIFGQDVKADLALAEYLKQNYYGNIQTAHCILSDEYSNLKGLRRDFFELLLMSYAKRIYRPESSQYSLVAHIISEESQIISYYDLFSTRKIYSILLQNLNVLNLSSQQKATSYYRLYEFALLLKDDQMGLKWIKMAYEYDKENLGFALCLYCELIKNRLFEESEKIIIEVFQKNLTSFLKVLLSNHFQIFRNILLSFLKQDYQPPHLSFIASKIYEFQRNFQESLKCAKLAYEAEPKNEIFKDHLLKLLLEQPTPQPKVTTKEVIKEKLIIQEKPIPSIYLVAKDRIHNHLAYKLGSAMILNSKSLWGYMRMPYVLSYIKESHKKEQKEYEAKVKKNPSLKLPPIESYADYEQALKEKECFTYKLGKALITANSVRGGGGEYLLISNSFKKCVG